MATPTPLLKGLITGPWREEAPSFTAGRNRGPGKAWTNLP